jgi:hypothetical protein
MTPADPLTRTDARPRYKALQPVCRHPLSKERTATQAFARRA